VTIWICRRDGRIQRRSYAEVIRYGSDGLPYLSPEIVLLFKAKTVRKKDQVEGLLAVPRHACPVARWVSLARRRIA
jgi:hypothetical protein